MLKGFVALEVEGRNDEQDKVHEEPYHLHTFASIEFVVDEECLKLEVSHQLFARCQAG